MKYVLIFFIVRVLYRDGIMEHEPKACAAVKGTQIMVHNGLYCYHYRDYFRIFVHYHHSGDCFCNIQFFIYKLYSKKRVTNHLE